MHSFHSPATFYSELREMGAVLPAEVRGLFATGSSIRSRLLETCAGGGNVEATWTALTAWLGEVLAATQHPWAIAPPKQPVALHPVARGLAGRAAAIERLVWDAIRNTGDAEVQTKVCSVHCCLPSRCFLCNLCVMLCSRSRMLCEQAL